MSSEVQPEKRAPKGGVVASGSALSGVAALIGASCCVLPIILVNLGVGSAMIARLGFFARNQEYFMIAAGLLWAGAVLAAFWGGRRPSRWVTGTLILAAILLVIAYILPFYEPELIRWVRQWT